LFIVLVFALRYCGGLGCWLRFPVGFDLVGCLRWCVWCILCCCFVVLFGLFGFDAVGLVCAVGLPFVCGILWAIIVLCLYVRCCLFGFVMVILFFMCWF